MTASLSNYSNEERFVSAGMFRGGLVLSWVNHDK